MSARANSKKLLKISKLSELTGVARDAIHFYIKEGILPKPIKTKKNMAYYDEGYVEKIKLIKELQKKRFLPLHIIKQILNETEGKIGVDEIRTIHEVDEKLFQNMNHNSCFKSPTLEELVDSTALSLEDIKKLEKLGVLVPQEGSTEKKYREDDIQIVEILSKLRQTGFTEERGFSLDLIEMYRDLMDVLVKQEIQIFTTRLTGKISRDEVLRMAEAAIHLTSILMGLLRKQSIMKITHEFGNESSQRPPA